MTTATQDGGDHESDMYDVPSQASQKVIPSRRMVRPKVMQHQATVQTAATDPGALHALEKRISEIVAAIRDYTLHRPSISAALAKCDANAAKNATGLVI
ncbi:hypothetical protein KEM55_005757, partial [Ascosphaera atra]